MVVALTLFVASVLGALGALEVFFWYDAGFCYVFEVGAVLKIAVVLLSGFVVSSGLSYRSGLLMSQCLHGLHPPRVTGEPFEEGRVFPVGHKRPGERLLQ